MDLENIQKQNQDLKDQIKTLKIKNIEIIQDNYENLQQNLQLLSDKEELLKENTNLKLRIEQLETEIKNLTDQNIELQSKEKDNKKKIKNLSIMNIEILKKLKYHELANFIEFQKNVNDYFISFIVRFLNYIISDYYLNLLKNIWEFRNLPFVNKIFKVFNYIFILWTKYMLAISFVSFYFINMKIFRNIEIIFIIFIINILTISYINYTINTNFVLLSYKKSCDFY